MKFKLTFLLLNDKESKTSLTLYRDSEVVALIQMKKKKKEVFIKTKWRKNNEVQRLRPGGRKKNKTEVQRIISIRQKRIHHKERGVGQTAVKINP